MPRPRRPAAETRAAMLAAAHTLLAESGPDGVHLDAVAATVGVSRQAVLHHFQSRNGLLRAVVEVAWLDLFRDLAGLATSGDLRPAAFVDRVDEVARKNGHARLGGWLLLSGEGLPSEVFEGALAALPERLVAQGVAKDVDEARFQLVLVGAALFGDAIFGGRFRQALGGRDSEPERARFRRYVAGRVWGPPAC